MITVHTWLTTAIESHLSWNGKHTEMARADYSIHLHQKHVRPWKEENRNTFWNWMFVAGKDNVTDSRGVKKEKRVADIIIVFVVTIIIIIIIISWQKE